jgi:RimJ/RimL family protein N-acetyltransferase
VNLEPLWELRLVTPRLVLRLPTADELDRLFAVAERGIHPPEEMPFEVPWTDDLQHDRFVDFHRSAWATWSPENWTLHFVTFHAGEPIGTQDIAAVNFAERREVGTASWLGASFQGHGYGTEQRAAVLELAFRGLAAGAATSGSLVHNISSQRVSEKLGYRQTGTHEIAPRGEPVTHLDYRIEASDWRNPVPVELVGLDPCLPLLGALPRSG